MTGTVGHLLIAAIVFVGSHFALSSPKARAALVARLGEGPFSGLYSAIAAVSLLWLILAYGNAPYVELWMAASWTRWLPVVTMPFAALFLVCALSQYNPTVVGRRIETGQADPAPGILKITRHPMLWAFGLWALAHIPPNGDLASLILFAAIAVLAFGGTAAIDTKRRARDPEGFRRFTEVTSNVPLAALLSPKKRAFYKTAYGVDPLATMWREIGLWRLTLAVALYVALSTAHPWITGVPAH